VPGLCIDSVVDGRSIGVADGGLWTDSAVLGLELGERGGFDSAVLGLETGERGGFVSVTVADVRSLSDVVTSNTGVAEGGGDASGSVDDGRGGTCKAGRIGTVDVEDVRETGDGIG